MNKETPSLFGVRLEGGNAVQVIAQIERTNVRPFWIVTANPEMLLAAQEDAMYRSAMNAASWRTIDGFGLKIALMIKGKSVTRLTGVDLGEALLRYAADHGWRVAFFGGSSLVTTKAAEVWHARYPNVDLRVFVGGVVQQDGSEDGKTWEDREAMKSFAPHLVLVALGGGKKQELWIQKHRMEFPETRVIMGIGGAFDMWSGARRRAPKLARALGFEWLWRVLIEPTRWKRIWRATGVFLYTAFFKK